MSKSGVGFQGLGLTHRLLSSSFLGLPYRILNMNLIKKELLRSLWVGLSDLGFGVNVYGFNL